MKKILSILLILFILISVSLNIAAEEEKVTFKVSGVTANKGSVAYVPVEVLNNTGMAGVVLTFGYDETALTLKGYENGTVYSTLPEVGINYVWTESGKNTTVNGTLITLVFSVNETAVEGSEYPVTVTVRECSDIDRNSVETEAVNGKISIQAPHSEITSANVSLGTDISVKYYANLAPVHSAAQMRFTMNGVETVVDGTATGEDGIYVYTFRNIAPQCMGDNIKAELILDGETLDVKEEYSVETYCKNTLAKSASDLGMSEEKHAALHTLIADVLEYGAKAQIYKGYNTDNLVNCGITGKSEFTELTDQYEKYIDESGLDDVKMTAAGVYFDYTNSLYLKFTAPDMTEEDFYILAYNEATDEEVEYKLSDCTLLSEETSTYVLVLNPCSVMGYDDLYYIDLYAPNSRGRVVVQQSLEYSVASYVYSMQNKKDGNGNLTPMAELARATYNYGLSATAYNEIAN